MWTMFNNTVVIKPDKHEEQNIEDNIVYKEWNICFVSSKPVCYKGASHRG